MKQNYRLISATLALFLSVAGLAGAQTLSASPDRLALTAASDGSVQSQVIRITSSGAPLLFTVSVTTNGTGNWLYASPPTAQTPADIIVSANANQLPNGVYDGAVLVQVSGSAGGPLQIPVSLSVGTTQPPGTPGLAVTPTSLSFVGQAGGVPPASQQLGVTSTPSGLTFTATASTNDSGNWLQVSSTVTTAPATVLVSINTFGMAAGVYSGSIVLAPSQGTSTTIPVTLTLGGGSMIGVSASSLQFFYQLGWFLPTYQTIDVSSSGSPLAFSVVASTIDGVGWLNATPAGGTTRQTITVSVTPGLLGPGTYRGKLTISSLGSFNTTVEIPVNLTVSNSPLLTAGAFPTTFVYQTSGATPAAQSIAIGSTSSPINFAVATSTTDGNGWLGVTPLSGTTPQNLTVVVTPGSLIPGTYTGTIQVIAAGASNSPLKIPITMTISAVSQISLSPPSLQFNYQLNGQSQVYAQQVGVYATGAPVTVAVTTSTTSCGGNWLRSYQTTVTTPQVVTIAFDPILLSTPAICQGGVTFTPVGGGTPVTIPVAVVIATTPLMNVSPLALTFSAPFDGEITQPQTLNLAMTNGSAVTYTATASPTTGGNWMRVNSGPGTTPGTVSVSADPAYLGVGTYSGNVVIGSAALTTALTIPVTFKVTATETATVAPLALSFTQAAGGAPPAAQYVNVTSARGTALSYATSVTAQNAGNWLTATPNSGSTPATLSVSVNGSTLTPGTYTGSVTLVIPAAANSPVVVQVTLVVSTGQTVSATPASLAFTYRIGGNVPEAQTIRVTSSAAGVNVSSGSSSTGNWLSITPVSNTTPALFTVTVAPGALSAGSYNGSLTLTAPGAIGSPITIPVKLDVLPAVATSISSITNAASGVRGVISPGEIVTLRGSSMGPADGAVPTSFVNDTVGTSLAGTRVLFDEVAAPLLYVGARQINAIVPYEVAGRRTVQVTVEFEGVRSEAFTLQVAATAPAIFTADQSGRGQGAILNQDYGYNSLSAPAAAGSVVQVFGTGEGVLLPAPQSGAITRGTLRTVAKVTATVGGIPADVQFAGASPGQVAGLFQVNVVLPSGLPSGSVPIVITFGDNSTQTGVTVAVK